MPDRVRVILSAQSAECACINVEYEMVRTSIDPPVWETTNAPLLCGAFGNSRRSLLSCFSTDWAFSWTIGTVPSPNTDFFGIRTLNPTQGACCNFAYFFQGRTLQCSPFFMQWRGMQVCRERIDGLGNCQSAVPLCDGLVDVTVIPA